MVMITITTIRVTTTGITMDESFPWLARLLQVNDSAFPTGGYAHSYGFEQIVQTGFVHDADSMSAPSRKSSLADVDSFRITRCPLRAGRGIAP